MPGAASPAPGTFHREVFMLVAFYADNDGRQIARQITEAGHQFQAFAAYLFKQPLAGADRVYAPGRPDIIQAYASIGVPEYQPNGQPLSKQVSVPKMQSVAVLSCGPSGTQRIDDVAGIPVIGVNTAPTWHPCDYWVALDGNAYSERLAGKKAIGEPVRIVPQGKQADKIGKWAPLEDYAKPVTWSSITAVMVALSVAEKVYLVGFDLKPGLGSDGLMRDSSRNFAHEAQLLAELERKHPGRIERVNKVTPQAKTKPPKRKGKTR